MKRTHSFSIFGATILSLCFVLGCKLEASQPATGAQSVSAGKNSFQETTSRLDAGGNFYLYLSTEQLLDGLAGKVSGWRQLFASMPALKPGDLDMVNKAFDVATHVIKNSGVEDVSGVGLSSIAIEPGLYRNKMFLHHYQGKGKGFLWTMWGQRPHPLAELDLLPSNTALAVSSDFDIPMLWSAIRDEVAQAGFPQAGKLLEQLPAAFEKSTGLKWDQALASLGGEFGLVLTLNESNTVTVPLRQHQPLQVPEPGLMLVAKAKDDTIFNRLQEALQKSGGDQVVRVDKPNLKMRTLPLPLPLPIQVRLTVATSGGYLFVASSDALIQEALAVKAGQKPGLKAQAEFKRLARDIPSEGNGFSFVSQHFGQTIIELQKQALDSAGQNSAAARAWLQSILQSQQAGFGYFVSANTAEGWFTVGNANQGQAKVMLLSAAVAPAAVASAMLLPALAKAKERAQKIACVNNLKQLCLAAKVWAVDHNGVFPPDLISMKAEIATPKILFCPADTAHKAAADWSSFTPENCSYEFLAPGAGETEPDRVVFRCPIHGTVGLADGSVQQIAKTNPRLIERDGKLYLRPTQ